VSLLALAIELSHKSVLQFGAPATNLTTPQAAEMSVDHRIQSPIAANIAELHDNLNTRELPVVAAGARPC
jgi:hypothetical protein